MSFEEQLELLVEEKVSKVLPDAINKALESLSLTDQNPSDTQIIRGVNNLAKFLQVSVPTALKIKNEKLFPCYQWGRVMVFKSNEVLAGMRARKV
ncbi:MAG: DUF3853 family protein [Clostridia bacterium]|nr:DUF3853 family protein [Clostridia bacterium]